jgi:hypothetical protein
MREASNTILRQRSALNRRRIQAALESAARKVRAQGPGNGRFAPCDAASTPEQNDSIVKEKVRE